MAYALNFLALSCLGVVITLLVILVFLGCSLVFLVSQPYPIVKRSKNERYYTDPVTNNKYEFPSIEEPSTLHLSVIIPAYNEEERLPPMLDECTEFLEKRSASSNFKYEIIVVSDGSKDGTVKVSQEYAKKLSCDKVRVLDLETNRGKGGAVRLGMQSARGSLLLFADADGATKFSDLIKVEKGLSNIITCDYLKDPTPAQNKLGISIGSRAHLEEVAVASRSFFRTILMYGFHFVVWFFAVRGIRDTQCGFKLLTREAGRICFDNLHVERWAFDVEMLYIAQKIKIPIAEVSVTWTEIDGSKVTPVWSWIQMGMDLVLIWLRYTIGAWRIKMMKDS